MDPATIAMIAGTVSSLFSRKPKFDESQQIQMDMARQMQAYSKSVPMSDPQEMAALAQQRGLMGNEQNMVTNQLLGSMNPMARTSTQDMMTNLQSSQAGQRGALDMEAIMEALRKRREAMFGAAQIAGGVGAPRDNRQSNVPALMGQLAQMYAQQQAMKSGMGPGGGGQPGGGMVAGQQVGSFQFGGGVTGPMGMGGGVGAQAMPAGAPALAPGPQSGASGFLGAWGQMLSGMQPQGGGGSPFPYPVGGVQQPALQPTAAMPNALGPDYSHFLTGPSMPMQGPKFAPTAKRRRR